MKVFFESDNGNSQYTFTDDKAGQLALGELVFTAIQDGHAAYVMITPDDIDELIEDSDGEN